MRSSPTLALAEAAAASLERERGLSISNDYNPTPRSQPVRIDRELSSQFVGSYRSPPAATASAAVASSNHYSEAETTRDFPNTEQALSDHHQQHGDKFGGATSSEHAVDTTLQPPSDTQYAVHFILAKLWCDGPTTYGYPAYDGEMSPLGFYRDVTKSGGVSDGTIVFIPIVDADFGTMQLQTLTKELEEHISRESEAVKDLDKVKGGGVGALLEKGKQYFSEKDIAAWKSSD